MITLAAAILLALLVAGIYWLMRRQPDRRSLWRTTLYIGLGTGVVRASLSSLGWYIVEHTGGSLQVPAFALAMMAWPEAAVFTERRLTPAGPAFYAQLSLLLVTSTLVFAAIIAAIAARGRVGRVPR